MSRISPDWIAGAIAQLSTVSKTDHEKVNALANVRPLRSVLHKTPVDHGMTGWRDICFPDCGYNDSGR